MLLEELVDILTPGQVAKCLREQYGHSVTAYVITKWDNMILCKDRAKDGNKNPRRAFGAQDLVLFNAIAVLRTLGYGIPQIQQIFTMDLNDPAMRNACEKFHKVALDGTVRLRRGLDLYRDFMDALSQRSLKQTAPLLTADTPRVNKRKNPMQPEAGVKPKPKVLLLVK